MDDQNKLLVSVIVRTKDRPYLLNRAIRSISTQTYRPVEVVLVNDGGSDLAVAEITELLGDISLNYIKLEKNMGRAHAGNVGIENAQGEFVGFLDDDDEITPDHFNILVKALEKNPAFVMSYSDAEIVKRQYDKSGSVIAEHSEGIFKSFDPSYEILQFENYMPLICCLFRKSAIQSARFDESFELYEDWGLLLRVLAHKHFAHVPHVTARYIQWSASEQIAFSEHPSARESYLRILDKNKASFKPETILTFVAFKENMASKQKILFEQKLENLRKEKELELNLKKREIHDRDEEIRDRDREIRIKDAQLESKIRTVDALQREISDLQRQLEAIYNTLGWILMERVRKIRRRLFPEGTKRASLLIKFLKILMSVFKFGVTGTIKKLRNKTREHIARRHIRREKIIKPVIIRGEINPIDRKVSVIIPTKDAGAEFRQTLERLCNQKGLREIEIIAVDSGSADSTVLTAQNYGVRVYSIAPAEFNHGRVRNIGAEKATGDYVVFLSQDVIPVGETCLHDMISLMEKDNDVVAATAKQIPRSDADLFACWQLWYYYTQLLGLQQDRITGYSRDEFLGLEPSEKRRAAQIDNIFSCIRKDIFDAYKFNALPYAEDLDLGMRLIADGHKIAYFASVGAIHSHNRPPAYYFKRSFIDVVSLISLLGFQPIAWDTERIVLTDDMISSLMSFYETVKNTADFIEYEDLTKPQSHIIEKIKALLREEAAGADRAGEESLDKLFSHVKMSGENVGAGRYYENRLLRIQYEQLLTSFGDYLKIYDDIEDKRHELVNALYKLFAVVAGSNLGNFASFRKQRGGVDSRLSSLADMLMRGV